MIVFAILLVCWVLCAVLWYKKRNEKRAKLYESDRMKAPHPKDFANYYDYKAKLVEYNEAQYKEHLQNCAKNGEIPIEKEIISKPHEKRLKNYDDLISRL